MNTMKMTIGVLLGTVVLGSAPLEAQIPQASATALGMGFNMTASARGFAAVANNPAGLGMANSPGFSLAIPAVSFEVGLNPVTGGDLVDWQGQVVPAPVKEEWLALMAATDGQHGTVGAGVSSLALNIGPFGFQASALGRGIVAMTPDAAELLLYGNAGRDGVPGDFQLDDSALDGFMISTFALSYGFRVSESLALGVTGTYLVGNGLVVGRDAGTQWLSDPLGGEVSFPILYPTSEGYGFDNGSGLGLDLGAIWSGSGVTVGASVQNVVNTFEWKLDRFSFVPGQALFELGGASSDFDEQPAASAPRSILDAVGQMTPRPVYSVGLEVSPSPMLRLQADLRKRSSEGLALGPAFHAGVGAELTALSFLPVRGHFAIVSGGAQFGGGASVVMGPVNLSGAIARQTGDFADATLAMITLSFGAR